MRARVVGWPRSEKTAGPPRLSLSAELFCDEGLVSRTSSAVMHPLLERLSYFFAHYGYWTILIGLLLESAGVPLPGETILITAAILARTQHELNIVMVCVVAVIAATLGDNLGFALGRYAGRPLIQRYRHIFHIEQKTVEKGEELFRRRGAMAVFLARFVAGLRILAGPLAGTLRMDWRKFVFFNALGAIAWVGAIGSAGYFFGEAISGVLQRAGLAVGVAVVTMGAIWWWREKRKAS